MRMTDAEEAMEASDLCARRTVGQLTSRASHARTPPYPVMVQKRPRTPPDTEPELAPPSKFLLPPSLVSIMQPAGPAGCASYAPLGFGGGIKFDDGSAIGVANMRHPNGAYGYSLDPPPALPAAALQPYLHAPPDTRTAVPPRTCLVAGNDRAYDPFTNQKGQRINQVGCLALVEQKLFSGAWTKELVEGHRHALHQGQPPQTPVYEFIVAGTQPTFGFNAEFKLAGYGHYSEYTKYGWTPFVLSHGKKGWGRQVHDERALEAFHAEQLWNTPAHVGDGIVFRGVRYGFAHHPDATILGPRGAHGPRWGSNWTGD